MYHDRRKLMLVAFMALAACLTSACDTARTVAPLPVAPAASSPAGAVARLGWAFNHRDPNMVNGLLTDDFVFVSAVLDSAGDSSRDTTVIRSGFLAELQALLDGRLSAAHVSLTLDPNLIAFPDTRPGRNPTWHKTIRSSLELVVVDSTAQRTFEASGHGLFFLARGDSASIPAEQVALGVKPDSTRWWIDRWEDETIGGGGGLGAHANPTHRTTLWDVLRFYLNRLTRP